MASYLLLLLVSLMVTILVFYVRILIYSVLFFCRVFTSFLSCGRCRPQAANDKKHFLEFAHSASNIRTAIFGCGSFCQLALPAYVPVCLKCSLLDFARRTSPTLCVNKALGSRLSAGKDELSGSWWLYWAYEERETRRLGVRTTFPTVWRS